MKMNIRVINLLYVFDLNVYLEKEVENFRWHCSFDDNKLATNTGDSPLFIFFHATK